MACWHSRSTAVALLFLLCAQGRAEIGKARRGAADAKPTPAGLCCKIYNLSELGNDPGLGEWLANVLPFVVDPGSWCNEGGEGKLSYFAPRGILVVYQTPQVHADVAAFLSQMRDQAVATGARTLPAGGFASSPRGPSGPVPASAIDVECQAPRPIPAGFIEVGLLPPGGGAALSKVAPHALPATPAVAGEPSKNNPRHLFHIILEGLEGPDNLKLKNFTLRYEGEGIIDSNIVELLKSLARSGGGLENLVPKAVIETEMTLPTPRYLEKSPTFVPGDPLTPPNPSGGNPMQPTGAVPASPPAPPSSPFRGASGTTTPTPSASPRPQ